MQILRLYWDILRLKLGPQDLPVSKQLLVITALAQLGIALVLGATAGEPRAHSQALAVIDCFVVLVWGAVLLRVARRPERFLQTATAIFGCTLLLHLLISPLALLQLGQDASSGLSVLAAFVSYALGLWGLIAVARIVNAATGWSMLICILMTILQEVVTLLVAITLFPDILTMARELSAAGG